MGQNRQNGALLVTVLFPILSAIFVALRSYSRYLGRNFGWDDSLIVASLVLLIGETICVYEFIVLSHTGYRVDERPKLAPWEQVTVYKWSFALQLFYHPLMGAIRASIIMFLFRIQDNRAFIRTALHTVFWINIGYMISTTAVNIFQCSPVRYTYMFPVMDEIANGKVIKAGKCIESLRFVLASCGLSIFMDLIIIPIPTIMVWNLQLRRKLKIAVVIIMSMGWIATAISVLRFIVYYYRFSPTQKDRTYNIGIVVSIAEPAVGIIAACTPAMKSLLSRLAPRLFSSRDANYYSNESRSRTPRRSSAVKSPKPEAGFADGLPCTFDEEAYGMTRLGSVDSREGGIYVAEPEETMKTRRITCTDLDDSDEDYGRVSKDMLHHAI